MVRNHQDGYPYINLALFFFENLQKCQLFWRQKNWPMNSGKKNSIFKTWQKMVTKFGQFKKPKWPFSSLQFCTFFCENIQNPHFFLEKLLGQWIPDRDGRGIARDIKKKYFHFWNATKNSNKVGTIYKVGTFKLFKLSKLCFHSLSSFEYVNNFFGYP